MSYFSFYPFWRRGHSGGGDSLAEALRAYLEGEAPTPYGQQSLEDTVQDVLALEPDLKDYVSRFLETGESGTDLACECASIRELLETGSFTPVTAALFLQWYRRDPVGAAAFLLHRDTITELSEELYEAEE